MAIDKVTSAAITDGTITSSDLASGAVQNQSAFRNIFINGDMSQAQRSTSTSSITSAGYHTVDRIISEMGTAGTWTQSQSTDVPTGQGFAKSLKMDCTTANGSLSAGSYLNLSQRIEGQNLQYLKFGTSSAESLTASFWVKSNKTGTYICEIANFTTNKTASKSYTISSADTWEKKTLTFTGDTATTIANDNARSFNLNFWLLAGSTYSSGTLNTSFNTLNNANRAVGQVNLADSTSNEWYITGVQLETGTSASDFEFLPVGVNLQRCQRYYFKTQDGVGTANALLMTGGIESSTSAGQGSLTLPTEMRTTPTLSFGSGVRFYSTSTSTVTPTIAGNRSTSSNLSAVVTISGGTNGQAGYCYQAAASGNIIGEAEL